MAAVSYQIADLLVKMESPDKDVRFKATYALMVGLEKDNFMLDDDSEGIVVLMMLQLLEDKNGEVQNFAVKCLGSLVNKVKEFQVETIVEKLCTNILSDGKQLLDISREALEIVIDELSLARRGFSINIRNRITDTLTSAIKREEESLRVEALEMATDLLELFEQELHNENKWFQNYYN